MLSLALAFCVTMFLIGAVGLYDAAFNNSSWLKGALGLTVDGSDNSWTAFGNLMKRASDGTTGNSTFVNRKCPC